MFSSFLRKRIPEISVFHNPSSPPSSKAVSLLRSALSDPYPPNTSSTSPLTFDLTVVESSPTGDQLKTILTFLNSSSSTNKPASKVASTTFLSSHPSAPALTERPDNVHDIAELVRTNPNALKWPVVVDWMGGSACVGGDVECVKRLLEVLRRKRDGEEVEGEEVDQPPKGWFT